jgi:hypothetical protein
MAFIQAKAIKVYYTKGDRKPYDVNGKPLSYLGQESIGANIATQVRFYLGEDLSESITPIVVTKRADGDRHFDILAEGTDTEVTPNQKYYYVDLSNWYAEKVGKLTLALKVYSGTVTIVDDEITASTGRIVVSDIFHIDVAYAPDASDLVPPFDPDYYEELLEALANKVERQEVIQVVNTLPTVSSADNGKWFLVRQTNGGRLYRVLGGVAVEVETEMGKLKLTSVGNGDITTNTGRFAWEQPNGTVELGLYNDVVLHLGEDVMYYAKADGSIVKGDVVQFAGHQGDHAIIKKAVPSEINVQPKLIMGIAKQNFLNNEFGYVLAFGKLQGVDTKGYENEDLIWFDSGSIDTGKWTNVMPTAPNAKVLLAVVVKQESSSPANNGVILVRPTFESKLDDLQNVLITSAVSGNVLRYDGTKWVNTNALTTAESEIDTLQGDVIGLDNTKADITYVDGQDTNLSNRITFIETNGGIDFIKVANFASLPSSGDVRNHRLFMTIDTKQLWEWDGSQWNESSPTDLSTINVTADSATVALTVQGEVAGIEDIAQFKDGDGDIQVTIGQNGNIQTEGDVLIEGSLTVNGTTTTVNTTTVAIEDNIILINSNQTGTPSGTLKGGIEIERGDETNYQFIFDESDDRFKIGQVGSLQTVATRQDDGTVVANGIPFYNDTEKRFDTSSVLTWSSATGRVSASQFFASNAIFTPYVASANGQPSSSINFASTGTTISRNVNDANHTLIVNNIHASSTGNIANFQWQGTNRLEITRDGFLNQNGTRLFDTNGTGNTHIGLSSGGASVKGEYNIAVGQSALSGITNVSATSNIAVGWNAGSGITTGGQNVSVGHRAGGTITSGTTNTFIGHIAGFNVSQVASVTNSTALGNGSFTDKSNQMVFGNASVSEFKFDRNTSAIVLMPTITASSGADNTFERTSTFSNAIVNNLVLRHTTSADMVDNTGSGVLFQIRDSANVSNSVGRLGVVRSGADNSGRFTFETSNAGSFTEKMTILPNGNVGIGNSAPTARLDVSGGARIQGVVNVIGDGGVKRLAMDFDDALDAGTIFAIQDGVAFKNVALQVSGGNVGIGTATPATKLDVSGVINLNNNLSWANGNADINGQDTNLKFRTYTGSALTEKVRILGNGNVGIGTTTPNLTTAGRTTVDVNGTNSAIYALSVGGTASAFMFHTGTDLLISNERNGLVGFNANGDRRMTILADGKVGIGTATPTERLQINSPNTDSLTHYTNTTTGSANTDGFYVGSIGADAYLLNKESSNMFFRTADLERMRISGGGLVGINETSPSAQLQVKSGATTRVPLIVDTLASQTANLQEWKVNGSNLSTLTSAGYFRGAGLLNLTTGSNSRLDMGNDGTSIQRDIADANPSLIVNQVNASSTGDITQFRFGGTTQANIARDGIANFTGTPSNEQTGDYTLVLADKGKVLRVNSSSNRTITIPLNSSVAFPIDTEIALIRYGSGTVSISPTSGVTLNSISSNRKVKDRYGSCALKKIGTDEWVLVGSLEA